MKDNYILTAESVTEGHPDKLCDTIADKVLDACLEIDPMSHVACEVLATSGKILVAGEISTHTLPDIPEIVSQTVSQAGHGASKYEIEVVIQEQSPDITDAVIGDYETGAGDQGMMYGYACDETAEKLPLPVVMAHRLTRLLTMLRLENRFEGLGSDGKAQVSVEYLDGKPVRVDTIVLSCQHDEEVDVNQLRDFLEYLIRDIYWEIPLDNRTKILVNPSGRFVLGGFDADTGLTGRKLMVDTYGGLAPHGGGALSGKDCTKVDRSGAYMARYIAKNIVAAHLAKRCTVSLAYAIGQAEPVAVDIDTHNTEVCDLSIIEQVVQEVFDLTPDGMISDLGLEEPIFSKYCNYGHFTHPKAPWEQTKLADDLRELCFGFDSIIL